MTNTSSHAIGETYHMGCQSTCVCGGPNQPSCRPRCSFTRGTVTDLSCSERPDLDDPECCVQLVCAVTSTGGQRHGRERGREGGREGGREREGRRTLRN